MITISEAIGLRAETADRVQAVIAAAGRRAAARRDADQQKRRRRADGLRARHAAKLRRLAGENQENQP